MDTVTKEPQTIVLPAIGESFQSGFLAAIMPAPSGQRFALIVAPKADGQKVDLKWKTSYTETDGTGSLVDGFANSEAMNNKKHPAAHFCRSLSIGGFADWYLPAPAEQSAIWANLGPRHTPIEAFQKGAPEAYDESWYWTSRQSEFHPGVAWGQGFDDGYQDGAGKDCGYFVRAVRKVLIP